jgi:hypothetical protein
MGHTDPQKLAAPGGNRGPLTYQTMGGFSGLGTQLGSKSQTELIFSA